MHFFINELYNKILPMCCRWYREGGHEPLESVITLTDQGVTSILTFLPKKDDDGAVFRCTVWNRAMAANTKLEAIVNLNVNCKFTRTSIIK